MKPSFTCIIALALLAASTSAGGEYPPADGKLHAEFRLPDIRTGQPVSLSDYRGQKVLLIHFASW